MSLNPTESRLLRETIKKVSLPDDQTLIFELERGGKVTWKAEGDCCSDTWFETITNMGALKGHKVVRITEREIPEAVQKALKAYVQDEDELYGYTLKVKVGVGHFELVDIEFRNSSNGYYGGWIEETYERA